MPKVARICQYLPCSKPFFAMPYQVSRGNGHYCSRACSNRDRQLPLPIRFWQRVQLCSHGQDCPYCCFPWTGQYSTRGYGRITIVQRQRAQAHRIGWELWHHLTMPPEKLAAHYCNHPWCVNPSHLYPATYHDNKQDSVRIGSHLHGSRHPRSRLHESDILEIFRLTAAGLSRRQIAQHFQVRPLVIWDVIHRNTWRHVPIPAALLAAAIT
jgi:hypothetical protein